VRSLDNIFVSLHQWALGQEENSVSEAFAFVLQYMLVHEPEVGVDLLRRLTSNSLSIGAENAQEVSIDTQVTAEQKRPDIVIRTSDSLVYVEVKVEAGLGTAQLGNYNTRLQSSGVKNIFLVLLTRYRAQVPEGQEPDSVVRWFQVANWLEEHLKSWTMGGEVSFFLAQQFFEFLREKGMAIQHIDRELQSGTRALVGLLGMLENALAGENVQASTNAQWRTWLGFNIQLSKYYLGVYLADAHVLRFRTYSARLDRARAEALGKGRLWVQQNRLRWEHTVDLSSDASRFYEKSTERQLQFIEEFVHDCFRMVEQIIADEQVPEIAPPREDEGGI
jgi:hypothetical protein